jgi:hypothetical protein
MTGQLPLELKITRTDYAPGIPNEWRVEWGDQHSTGHRSVEDVLLMVRVILERIEREQVHR